MDPQPKGSTAPQSTSHKTPVVIGIYGVPGCGKTFLLRELKQEVGEENFTFYDGSKVIADVVPGGLDAFQRLDEQQKLYYRQLAIDTIRRKCIDSGKVAIIAGHFMFWPEEDEAGVTVCTENDLTTYTHILYLDVAPEIVAQRRQDDKERSRPGTSVTHLRKWQQAEKTQLRRLCRDHGILFLSVSPHLRSLRKIITVLQDFSHHTEQYNLSEAESRLDKFFAADHRQLETVLVMDADKTLAAEDTGALFWKKISSSRQSGDQDNRLKTLFRSSLGYTYTAFRQAALLYEETADDQKFDAICEEVASTVTMHPEFVSLLQLVAEQKHVGMVVVTCGLGRVWEKVLHREGLSKIVKVISGGRITDGFVVTAEVKGALVARLQNVYGMYVWAFGDSPLDLDMLSKADQAIVVVGDEKTRSKTMDAALMHSIDNGLRARQALLPSNASPRLDITKLPLIQFTQHEFVAAVLRHRNGHASSKKVLDIPVPNLQVLHATEMSAAKLLMTPMRDATVAGPVLRKAHRRVGWFLATEFLGEVIGVEEYSIPHVQGHHTIGHRLLHEEQTSIVALMRGGEPMALGINDAFPLAMFIHANRSDEIMLHHLQGQQSVVLVDSVVNSGRSVVQFVEHIRKLHATIRIVVVAGVVQAQSISRGHLAQALARYGISLVALRLSANKYTGTGTTDTGNRLFNTTDLL